MGSYLKQSTAVEIKLGPFVDSADGNSQETSLTVSQADVRLAKNGGDWAQKNEATSLVHEEVGWYRALLDATDTNTLGTLIVAVHEGGALPVWREFTVLAANVFDSLVGGGDLLDVAAAELGAQAKLDVNAEADTAIADALPAIADAVLDEVVEGSTTLRQSTRLANSAGGGKADGMAGATNHLRDLADTKNRVTATTDADGNRTSVTLDLT